MAQSAFVNPPVGSALKFYVDKMMNVDPKPFWQSDDEDIRFLGALMEHSRDHRLWKQPFEAVRDVLLRQILEDKHGREKVDFLFREFPDFVDKFACLQRFYEHQTMSQRERAPRKESPKNTAHMITATVFLMVGREMPGTTFNAKAEVTQKRLGPGLDRHHVGRGVKHFFQTCRRIDTQWPTEEGMAFRTVSLVEQFIAECDAERAKKLRKKA